MKSLELFQYKELIKNLVIKELKLRYKRSILGFLWTLLNPLGMILIYWLVFSRLFSRFEMEKYYLYLISGVLPWNFFVISLSQSANAITSNANLIKKIYLPKEIFPISIVLANLVNFVLALLLLMFFLPFFKVKLGISILLLPIVLLIQVTLTIGLTFIISCMNVFFNDTVHLLEVGLLAWFFLTPIVYPLKMFQEQSNLMFFLKCNPMLYLIELYHRILYQSTFPTLLSFLLTVLLALLFFKVGLYIFKKHQSNFAKVL